MSFAPYRVLCVVRPRVLVFCVLCACVQQVCAADYCSHCARIESARGAFRPREQSSYLSALQNVIARGVMCFVHARAGGELNAKPSINWINALMNFMSTGCQVYIHITNLSYLYASCTLACLGDVLFDPRMRCGE